MFLGGSCNPTTWRKDVAVPALEEAGVTFFNPQAGSWYVLLPRDLHPVVSIVASPRLLLLVLVLVLVLVLFLSPEYTHAHEDISLPMCF